MADTKTSLASPIVAKNATVALSGMGSVAGLGTGTATLTVKLVRVAMVPKIAYRSAIKAGFVQTQPPWVSANDTISFALTNMTAGALTPDDVTADIIVA